METKVTKKVKRIEEKKIPRLIWVEKIYNCSTVITFHIKTFVNFVFIYLQVNSIPFQNKVILYLRTKSQFYSLKCIFIPSLNS